MSTKPLSLTPTLANVASSATNVTLFAANPAARGRIIANDSTAILFIKYGATASATSFTAQIAPAANFVFPDTPFWSGQVDGLWASANGNARTTELA